MADDNNLHIGISAGVEDLKKGLKEAEKEVDGFSKEVEKSAKKTEAVSTSSDKNSKSLKKLSTSLTDVNGGMKDLTRESGNLGDKLQGISKVGSGVSTSMTGLVSGALIASGAILALAAAVGTALYFYGKHRAEAFDVELQYKRLNERVKEYEKSLWGLNKTILKGTQNAASEIASLRSLRAGIENINSPMETRLRHLDALKKKYPSLLKGISDEKILTGGLASVYDTLTTSILKSARARAGVEALTENIKKQFALEKKQIELSVKLSENAWNQKAQAASDYANKVGGAEAANSRLIKLEKESKELTEEHKIVTEDIVTLQGEAEKISKTIADNGGIVPIDYGVKAEIKGISKELSKLREAEAKWDAIQLKKRRKETEGMFAISGFDSPEFVTQFNQYSQGFKQIADDLNASIPEFASAMTKGNETLKKGLTDMEVTLQNFEQDFAMLVAGAITETAISIGESIGQALAEGEDVIAAIGSSLIGSMGKFLSEMGKLLITYGALAVAKGLIDIALSSGFGPVVIAAGAAAIVVGIALVAAGGAISAKASGGGGGGSTAGVSGGGSNTRSSSNSSVGSYSGGGAGGTYVFEIAGTKLIGVIQNSLARNGSLGGTNLLTG